ncbi:VOC family protein [Pseudonocardia sp. GCM10023141]|uniref:VOC family protein n=1 Tax=Pseudonocardia sp. GCM10023141 TaxID=3252653 RepID=UPI00361C0DBE
MAAVPLAAPWTVLDHVGLTVPDLDAATAFFCAAFGASVEADLVDEPLGGSEIETALGLPAGATVLRVRMLALPGGAGIELFEFGTVDQAAPVRLSDLGIQHLAVRVDDIDRAIERALAAGAAALAAPAPVPGTTTGAVWVYCRLPWGGLLELVHDPGRPRPSSGQHRGEIRQ